MRSPSRCNKRPGRFSLANNPVSCTECRAENGYSGNFEAVENNGTAFATKQCLYQKVAAGMENPKMQSLLGEINAVGVSVRQITRFHASI